CPSARVSAGISGRGRGFYYPQTGRATQHSSVRCIKSYNDAVKVTGGGPALIPLERFTDEAREALARVQQLLLRLRHNQLDAEHLLLALLAEPDGLIKAAVGKLDGF